MELISIIIPAYNAEKTIERCVNSIIGGGYTNTEVIVVNDGSTDNTGILLDKLAEKDKRIKVIHKENGGVSSARNTGLDNATGDLIAWCDADDYVDADWLTHQYDTYVESGKNADIVISSCVIEDSNGKVMFRGGKGGFKMDLNRQQAVFEFLKHKNITGVFWDKLFKKEILNKLHFDEKLSYFEDEFLLWNILKKAKRIVLNGYADYHYTVNQNSLMNSKINTKKIENTLFVKKTICDDTKTMGMDYYNLAFKKYILEIVGLINQVFYCGINEENLQGYRLLNSAAKEVGLKNLKHILGIKKKLLFVICYFKIKIPKFIYKIK